MWFTVVLVIQIIVILAMIAAVLLQRSEGGALGMGGGGGGGGGLMTSRGAGSALTRATAILAAMFFVCSIALTILARGMIDDGLDFDADSPAPVSTAAPQLDIPAVPTEAVPAESEANDAAVEEGRPQIPD